MDSRKPLTAEEIEDMQGDVKLINEFLELCSHRLDPWNMARVADAVAWLGVDKGKIVEWVHGHWDGEDVERKMMDMEKENARLLSRLTPPPDAAVREAVEQVDGEIRVGEKVGLINDLSSIPVEIKTLRTLLRAVQAPRLTEEQEEAVKGADKAISENVGAARDYAHEYWGTAEGDAIEEQMNLARTKLHAAFPELAGEVGK